MLKHAPSLWRVYTVGDALQSIQQEQLNALLNGKNALNIDIKTSGRQKNVWIYLNDSKNYETIFCGFFDDRQPEENDKQYKEIQSIINNYKN